MNLEDENYSADLELTKKEIETKYPLAAQIKKEQDQFLTTTNKDYLENLNNTNISSKEQLEISTAINKSLKLDIDSLYNIADQTAAQYEDITTDQLTTVLLQSIATTNENKIMRKIATRLIKKVGK